MEFFALFCDDAGTDQNGKLSIRGVFNELQAPDFPARQERMVLLVIVDWDDSIVGRVPFRIDLLSPDGEPTCTVDGHTDVVHPASETPARTQIITALENVLFVRSGRYQLKLKFRDSEYQGPSLYLRRN